jgi:phosphoglycolate phosphatase-like HAD superfamily hydrolase
MGTNWSTSTLLQKAGNGSNRLPASYVRNGPSDIAREAIVPLPASVSGLVFGTDDLLYDATVWWRWLLQLLSRMGMHTHFLAMYRVWRHEYLPGVVCGQCDFWDALRAMLRSAGLTSGQIDEVLVASRPRKLQLEQNVRPFPGVKSTLARLAASGIPMAVFSFSSDSNQCVSERLRSLGVLSYFSVVLSSVELGVRLTEAGGYRSAAEAIGIPSSEMAFVGHGAEDLAGAADAEMLTIAVNYDADARADVFLERFDQLDQTVQFQPVRRQTG